MVLAAFLPFISSFLNNFICYLYIFEVLSKEVPGLLWFFGISCVWLGTLSTKLQCMWVVDNSFPDFTEHCSAKSGLQSLLPISPLHISSPLISAWPQHVPVFYSLNGRKIQVKLRCEIRRFNLMFSCLSAKHTSITQLDITMYSNKKSTGLPSISHSLYKPQHAWIEMLGFYWSKCRLFPSFTWTAPGL